MSILSTMHRGVIANRVHLKGDWIQAVLEILLIFGMAWDLLALAMSGWQWAAVVVVLATYLALTLWRNLFPNGAGDKQYSTETRFVATVGSIFMIVGIPWLVLALIRLVV